jgi:hypothetical protein
VDGTSLRLCPVTKFGVSGVELSRFSLKVLVIQLVTELIVEPRSLTSVIYSYSLQLAQDAQ